jgi:hypothetical protein
MESEGIAFRRHIRRPVNVALHKLALSPLQPGGGNPSCNPGGSAGKLRRFLGTPKSPVTLVHNRGQQMKFTAIGFAATLALAPSLALAQGSGNGGTLGPENGGAPGAGMGTGSPGSSVGGSGPSTSSTGSSATTGQARDTFGNGGGGQNANDSGAGSLDGSSPPSTSTNSSGTERGR